MTASGLNIALADLRSVEVRERALPDLAAYLAGYDVSEEEAEAFLKLDWPRMFALGASPYTMNKLRHINRLEHDDLGPGWRNWTREQLEDFLTAQNEQNAPYALPVVKTR